MTDKEITKAAYKISNQFSAVNSHYLTLVGKQVNAIGKQPSPNKAAQRRIAQNNINRVRSELEITYKKSLEEIDELYDTIAKDLYSSYAAEYAAAGITQQTLRQNGTILNYIESIRSATANTFHNLSNTTNISAAYINLVDTAVEQIATGVTDYNSAIRTQLRNAGSGARVTYESGVTRRLDSAVRMNILEGARQINQGMRQEMGRQFGADGYEIDVHGLCAPDHQDIQGKRFTIKEFNDLQNNLERPIGTCNCKHGISPVIMSIGHPVYSASELAQINNYSNEMIPVGGTAYTRYECTQSMRQLETSMRYIKDDYILANSAGDTVFQNQCETRLRSLQSEYRSLSRSAAINTEYYRAYVPGYRGVVINRQ